MKAYHGTHTKLEITDQRGVYFASTIEDAREYAIALDDCGNYNKEIFIYETNIDCENIEINDDFEEFDLIGYSDYENISRPIFNPESGYFCVKNPETNLIINEKIEL